MSEIENSKIEDSLSVEEILQGARNARSEMATSQEAVEKALALAPDNLGARMGAYKFYLYTHRLDTAALHAEWLLSHFAGEIGVAGDWRAVGPADAGFSTLDFAPRRYLQALIALGYCRARSGDLDFGRAALAKARDLDGDDRFGAGRLLAVLEREGREAEDD